MEGEGREERKGNRADDTLMAFIPRVQQQCSTGTRRDFSLFGPSSSLVRGSGPPSRIVHLVPTCTPRLASMACTKRGAPHFVRGSFFAHETDSLAGRDGWIHEWWDAFSQHHDTAVSSTVRWTCDGQLMNIVHVCVDCELSSIERYKGVAFAIDLDLRTCVSRNAADRVCT